MAFDYQLFAINYIISIKIPSKQKPKADSQKRKL
jgi:hypothetical protein